MTAGRPLPYVPTQEGIRLAVRLTPRASRTGLDGLVEGADGLASVQMRVAAAPVEGAANAALIAALAEALSLRRSEIRIVAGETARRKILALSGDAASLATRVDAWIAGAPVRR